jgi:ribosomal protein S17
MASHLPHDQTRFSVEEPLFEQMGHVPEPDVVEIAPRTPLLKQKKFVIGLIAGITIVILGLLFVINAYIAQQKLVKEPDLPDDPGQTTTGISHPLLQRIMSSETELKAADPSGQDLVYPALDYNIRIDPKVEER